jgi:hypothetical protein
MGKRADRLGPPGSDRWVRERMAGWLGWLGGPMRLERRWAGPVGLPGWAKS